MNVNLRNWATALGVAGATLWFSQIGLAQQASFHIGDDEFSAVQPASHILNSNLFRTSANAAHCDSCDSPACGCEQPKTCDERPSCESKGDCDSRCGNLIGEECEAWTLFPNDNGHGITFNGWVQGGITLNSDNNAIRNDPVPFSSNAGEFYLNQLWATIEKATDTGGCGWDFGFRIDYVFGADGPDTQTFGSGGWDFGWNSSVEYGSAIPQIYGEIAYNDVKVKLGHFFTIIGYEVVPATGNFFYSHAYTMNYGEPFTHTGALAEWTVNDDLTVWGGYTFGWDSGFDNYLDAHTFLGGVAAQVSEKVKVIWAANAGDFGDGTSAPGTSQNAGNIYMNSIVVDVALADRLNYVFQHDLGVNSGLGAGNSEWYGINQYLLYTINDCWKMGFRFEWFDDSDGARIAGVDADYYDATIGMNWTPTANLTIRPEIRFDWTDGAPVFANGTRDNLQTFAFDAIMTF